MDSKKKSFLKALSWRVTGTLDTFIISWLITGSPKLATGIAGIEVVSKVILYYIHERVWAKVKV